MLSRPYLEDLVLALLSVNNYPVTDAWALLPRLHARGLCDPVHVREMTQSDIATQLKLAGYDRGKITEILAPRLRELLNAAHDGTLDELPTVIRERDYRKFSTILLPIQGVGPRVVETAWLLLTSPTEE